MKAKLTTISSILLLVLGLTVAVPSATADTAPTPTTTSATAGPTHLTAAEAARLDAPATTSTTGFPSPAACQYAGSVAKYGGMERTNPQFRHYLQAGHFCLHVINYNRSPDVEYIYYLTAGSGQLIIAVCVRGARGCKWLYHSGNTEPAWAVSFGKGPANGLDTCDQYLELWDGTTYDWHVKVKPFQNNIVHLQPYVRNCEVKIGYTYDSFLYKDIIWMHINAIGYHLDCDYPFATTAICTSHLLIRPNPAKFYP